MLVGIGPPTIMSQQTGRYPEPLDLLEVEREILRREGSCTFGLESDAMRMSLVYFGSRILESMNNFGEGQRGVSLVPT